MPLFGNPQTFTGSFKLAFDMAHFRHHLLTNSGCFPPQPLHILIPTRQTLRKSLIFELELECLLFTSGQISPHCAELGRPVLLKLLGRVLAGDLGLQRGDIGSDGQDGMLLEHELGFAFR